MQMFSFSAVFKRESGRHFRVANLHLMSPAAAADWDGMFVLLARGFTDDA